MSKKRKKIFKFNFFLFLFIGFLIFTSGSFLIVYINENKNVNDAPKKITCESLSLVEEEILKLFPSGVFIAKDLEVSKEKSLKMIILEDQTEKSTLDSFKNNLDISLLSYGIYSSGDLAFKKGDYEFNIYFDNPYNYIKKGEVIKLPQNSLTLILKCVEENKDE